LSCDQKSKQESAIAKVPIEIAVVRLIFLETPLISYRKLKEIPFFFQRNDDAVWIERKMQNPYGKNFMMKFKKNMLM
jgi:hypothetical protein